MGVFGAHELTGVAEELPEWSVSGEGLVRTWKFADFRAALAFVNRIGEIAEEAGHHPDIDIRYNVVRLALMTHDESGVTSQDVAMATRLDAEK
jgi:4a-hydroxytetrahydrobiopterin dehydratase